MKAVPASLPMAPSLPSKSILNQDHSGKFNTLVPSPLLSTQPSTPHLTAPNYSQLRTMPLHSRPGNSIPLRPPSPLAKISPSTKIIPDLLPIASPPLTRTKCPLTLCIHTSSSWTSALTASASTTSTHQPWNSTSSLRSPFPPALAPATASSSPSEPKPPPLPPTSTPSA